jgi:beta-lactamase class A
MARCAGAALLVTISVEPADAHRINGLLFEAAPAVSWDEVDAALPGLGPRVSFLAAEVSDYGCSPLHAVDADQRLAIGSAFKLYVLGELARQVAAGEAAWDELLPIQDRYKSLPSGDMRKLPAGTERTLRYFAELMISQSDNTATDHLIGRLGRQNVETIQAVMGHANSADNIPFLTTREAFVIKLGLSDEDREAYLSADPERQRELLETVVASGDLPGLAELASFTEPKLIDSVEWFASATDLCNAMAYLSAQSERPSLLPVAEILSLNPGIALDRATWPIIYFKGGSEPGVVNLTYLLVRDDGRAFALALTVNNPDAPVDTSAAVQLIQSAAGLLAQST